MRRVATLSLMLLTAAVSGCADGRRDETVEFTFTNLPDLGPNGVYEAWLENEDGVASLGKFALEADGSIRDPTRFRTYGDLDRAVFELEDRADPVRLFVTMEPTADPSPGPSDQTLLNGDVKDREAVLSTATAIANLLGASGRFVIATPTDDEAINDTANDPHGVWWALPNDWRPGLQLPGLPRGWQYEGFVIDMSEAGRQTYYSTGRFTAVDGPDLDAETAPTRGKRSIGFDTPGQDFLNATRDIPELDLTSGRFAVLVSVEPEPDTGRDPFVLRPLYFQLPEPAKVRPQVYTMQNRVLATFPTATAKLSWGPG